MPTTRARKLNLNGFELSVTLDRMAAERVKSVPGIKRLLGRGPLRKHHGHEPEVHAKDVNDLYWYHVIDLGNGVVTPGFVDHRPQLDLYGLPASLAGKRCLDVATFDGFWAFEMERRGAAEVVAVDLDDPTRLDWTYDERQRGPRLVAEWGSGRGPGFSEAALALDSKARFVTKSVYDLDPGLDGTFDVVLC